MWQYVFALTVPAQSLSSSQLFRSASYGKTDTWQDITAKLVGEWLPHVQVWKAFTILGGGGCRKGSGHSRGNLGPWGDHCLFDVLNYQVLVHSFCQPCYLLMHLLERISWHMQLPISLCVAEYSQALKQMLPCSKQVCLSHRRVPVLHDFLAVCAQRCRPAGVDAARHDITGVREIILHSKPGRMLFQGLGFHHWISENFGETFEARSLLRRH